MNMKTLKLRPQPSSAQPEVMVLYFEFGQTRASIRVHEGDFSQIMEGFRKGFEAVQVLQPADDSGDD